MAAPEFTAKDAAKETKKEDKADKEQEGTISPVGDSSDTATENPFFYEDQVVRFDEKGRIRFGLVTETVETYSDDEEVSSILNAGEVKVCWYPSGLDEVVPESQLGLSDRTLVPGDIVRRLSGGTRSKAGYCRDVSLSVDLKVLGTKFVLKNLRGERMRPLNTWERDGAVVLDTWVGSVRAVTERAVLRHESGTKIEITTHDFPHFKDAATRVNNDTFHPETFYPGNVVVGRPHSLEGGYTLLTEDRPLPSVRKGKTPPVLKFTIESVVPDELDVNWQVKAVLPGGNTNVWLLPSQYTAGRDLEHVKRLNIFEKCMMQLYDRVLLQYSSRDTVVRKSTWDQEQALAYRHIQKQSQSDESVASAPPSPTANAPPPPEKTTTKKSDKFSRFRKCFVRVERFNPFASKDKTSDTSVTESNDDDDAAVTQSDSKDDGWVSEEDLIEKDEGFRTAISKLKDETVSSTTELSSCSSPSPRTSPRHTKRRLIKKRTRSFKRPFRSSPKKALNLKDGADVYAEVLKVKSVVTVVWQDGTVEEDITSTELYPLHHLDNHEFFPGDYVIYNKKMDPLHRDYGVVQYVNHEDRTAGIKWYRTYSAGDEPKPIFKGDSEVSVYDLRDHPDFSYRPGTMVIRVANFTGADATSTAGQVIDNSTDGFLNVWWIDGHSSLCWPQDVFEIGQYDQSEWGQESEDSWESESEESDAGDGSSTTRFANAKVQILAQLTRVQQSVERFKSMFDNEDVDPQEFMRKLMVFYRACRHLDHLVGTDLFHEDRFGGLVERVRKRSAPSITERAQNQKLRLFGEPFVVAPERKPDPDEDDPIHFDDPMEERISYSSEKSEEAEEAEEADEVLEDEENVEENDTSTPVKLADNNESAEAIELSESIKKIIQLNEFARDPKISFDKKGAPTSLVSLLAAKCYGDLPKTNKEKKKQKQKAKVFSCEKDVDDLLALVDQVYDATSARYNKPSQDDSGNFSRNEDHSSNSAESASEASAPASEKEENLKEKSSAPAMIDDSTPELLAMHFLIVVRDELAAVCAEVREKYIDDKTNFRDRQASSDGGEDMDEDPFDSSTIMELSKNSEEIKKLSETARVVVQQLEMAKKKELKLLEEAKKHDDTKKKHEDNEKETPEDVSMSENGQDAETPASQDAYEQFQILSNAPASHKFYKAVFEPVDAQQFYRSLMRDHRCLRTSLPQFVHVRTFEDRMDLLTIMIEGPKNTPYEDGLFLFDVQLPRDYPHSPPLFHYHSFCSERLNPNLYEEGKVCVSLLGTWSGRDTEMWEPRFSTLLQVIVSIQGLILVPEPYYNEAGYEKQKGTLQAQENSRKYNEMVIIKMVQSAKKQIKYPNETFCHEILKHFAEHGQAMHDRIKSYLDLTNQNNAAEKAAAAAPNSDVPVSPPDGPEAPKESMDIGEASIEKPEFSLVPASRGFCLAITGELATFKKSIDALTVMAGTFPVDLVESEELQKLPGELEKSLSTEIAEAMEE